uniref:Uncharacterized protein n=1 Tax=Anguilla anguilla TaxID=7936 RepID=A0A0E9V6Y4_ANGAN
MQVHYFRHGLGPVLANWRNILHRKRTPAPVQLITPA